MYQVNNNCYKFKKLTFNKGFFDKSVDATYIIHLENNGRLDSIYNQLKQYVPTKIVYILFNKGYKKCEKDDYINISTYDLVDAFITIFKDAKNTKYNNILILEDDFFFDNKINNKNICDNINNFIINKNDESYIYLLGCIPYLQIPYSIHTNISIIKTGSHASIYSNKFINDILKKNIKDIKDWDIYTNLNYKNYIYYNPLCYQLFPNTENSKNWGGKYFFEAGNTLKYIFKTLNLHKNAEPGYSYFYMLSKILFYIMVILFLIIIFLIYKFLIHKKKIKKIKSIK